ncbi:MAG: hypothetical protein K2I03_12640 [Lachnospiraceae bacterium]|nr:hypothetical protein [Lachnospiraceae bacterium]
MSLFGKKKFMDTKEPYDENEEVNTVQDEIEQEHHIAQNPTKRKQYVENCCEQIVEAEKRIEELKKEYQLVNSYLSDIQIISTLPETQKNMVVEQAKRIIVFNNDRAEFGKSMGKLTYKQYNDMEDNGDEIRKIIETLSEDEKYCQSVRTDMRYLEGEKLGLKMEQKDLNARLNSMSRLSKWTFMTLLLMLFVIWIYYYISKQSVEVMMYAVVLFGIVSTAIIFGIHQHTVREMKYVEARLNKAITLLNKIKLKYVNVASRLEYMYEKHGVKSSIQLSKVWNIYLQEKKKRQVYQKTSDKLLDAEEKLVSILDGLGVKDSEVWISQADAIIDKSEMERLRQKIDKRHDKIKATMDYNMDVMEKSKASIKELIDNNKKYAREIMMVVDSYDTQEI